MVAWSWYLVALLVAAWVLWRGSRFLPPVWRTLITLLPVLVALVPAPVSPLHESLAPAWIVALFDGLVQEEGSFWRAGKWVLMAAALSLLPVLVARRFQQKQHSPAEQQ
jgi:hypothetical protein